MTGNRAAVIFLAALAGGFVYPLWAQQGPTAPQSSPVAAPKQPAGSVPAKPPVIPGQIPAPGTGIPGPTGQQLPPQPQPGPSPVAPGPRMIPPQTAAPSGMVSLNFNRADLVEIIHIIAQQLRLTYTIDPEVKGTVTINSSEPLRSADLLPVFHQLLRMNGAVAVRTGNLYHIMPIKDGKGLARPVGQSREDSFALRIIPVRFFSVSEMKKVLTPFLQPGAEVVENPRGNFLIVMDLPSNIQRLVEIADMIDVQVFAGTRMEIYQPKVASAEELAQEMTRVMQSFAASAPQAESFTAQFIPLPRINQLLVISHSEAAWTYARRWLERIDVIAEGPGRRIFIYAVENGKATELADVLNQALGQTTTGTRSSTPTLQSLHRATPPTPAGQQPGTMGGAPASFGSPALQGQQRSPGFAQAAVAVPGQVPAPVVTPPQPGAAPAPGVPRPGVSSAPAQPPEPLRIVADPATNSLIIYGTAQEFQSIRNILKDLDAIPRQVLLEAMILQIDLREGEDFGVDYEIFRKRSPTIFGEKFDSSAALRTLGKLFPTAPAFGGVSGLSAIAGDNTVSAMIRAAATDSRIKIISSPSVLASDNRPARIQVGSEEPIPTGTINAVVGSPGVSSSTTIQYRNTGRILTIIPQVNSQGLVNLQIKAEVSARGEDVTVGQDSFPAFNTQDAETTAVVHDGETLVIGGLIGERKGKSRSGIPYLMDIPVFGRFFGTTSDTSERTELIMLITPRVIRNRNEAQIATMEFKSKLATVRNELERIEIERQRMQTQPQPQDLLPPISVPPPYQPQSRDSTPDPWRPPDRGTAMALTTKSASLPPMSAVAPAAIETAPAVRQPIADAQPRPRPSEPLRVISGAGDAVKREPAAPPAYALSIVERNTQTPKIDLAKPAQAAAEKTAARTWTVQVAALAALRDADMIAEQLRREGYDAYVVTAQLDSKTWHRVRVGQLKRLAEAMELRKALAANRQFKDPYVAAR